MAQVHLPDLSALPAATQQAIQALRTAIEERDQMVSQLQTRVTALEQQLARQRA